MSYVFIDLCSSKNMFSISTFINIYRAFSENINLYVVDVLFSVYWSYWSRLSSFTEHQGTSVPQNLKGFLLIKRLIDTKYFFQTPLTHHKSLACCGCFKFCVICWGDWLAVMINTTRRGNTSQNIGFSTTLKWNYFQKIQDLSNHL